MASRAFYPVVQTCRKIPTFHCHTLFRTFLPRSWQAHSTSSGALNVPTDSVCTVQTSAAVRTNRETGEQRSGIGIYLNYQNPANIALPIHEVWSTISLSELQEKAIMLGILVGSRHCEKTKKSILILSDSTDAVERLHAKFTTPQLEIRHVSRNVVTQAHRLARKACTLNPASLYDVIPDLLK